MKKLILVFLLLSKISFCQEKDVNNQFYEQRKIILFGEAHFVKEKYDEIKSFIFNSLDSVSKGEKATLFLELPSSFNYALNLIESKKDTSLFFEWFNHQYERKGILPSKFWTDYRDFLKELIQYADRREIKLKIKCIDRESEFRRTALVLSSFKSNLSGKMVEFLNQEYILNDSLNRKFLLNYVEELLVNERDTSELEILNQIKKALNVSCRICKNRDELMFENFRNYYDSTDAFVFGSFGLDHIVNEHCFSSQNIAYYASNQTDIIKYKSLYEMMIESFGYS